MEKDNNLFNIKYNKITKKETEIKKLNIDKDLRIQELYTNTNTPVSILKDNVTKIENKIIEKETEILKIRNEIKELNNIIFTIKNKYTGKERQKQLYKVINGVDRKYIEFKDFDIKKIQLFFYSNIDKKTELMNHEIEFKCNDNINHSIFCLKFLKMNLISLFMFLKNKNDDIFNCFFIEGNKAKIVINNSGNYLYMSYNNNNNTYTYLDVFRIMEVLYGYNLTQSRRFLSKKYGITYKELRWELFEIVKYTRNIELLETIYENENLKILNMYSKSYIDVLILLNYMGLYHLNSGSWNHKGTHVFYSSGDFMVNFNEKYNKKLNVNNRARVVRGVILFSVIGLLGKLSENEVQEIEDKDLINKRNNYTKNINKENNNTPIKYKNINFFKIKELTLHDLYLAQDIVIKLKENKLKVNVLSIKTLSKVFTEKEVESFKINGNISQKTIIDSKLIITDFSKDVPF